MKTNILIIGALLFSSTVMIAQQQLENPSFETWENVGSPTVEPSQWSSIKTSDVSSLNGLAPQVCNQSTDAHTGTYSVKLENKSAFSIIATGTLTNGRAHADMTPANGYVFTDASDAQWNTTFTDRPDSLVGWYKYAPATGDKAKVEAIIHNGAAKNPEMGTAANFVGRARFVTSNSTSTWTRFSVPFGYYNTNASTHILVVLASGDSTIAKNGSIAYFDDLELIYNPVSVEEIASVNVKAYQSNNSICVKLPETKAGLILATIYDLQGRAVLSNQKIQAGMNYLELPKNDGIYLVSVNYEGKIITKKVVVTN